MLLIPFRFTQRKGLFLSHNASSSCASAPYHHIIPTTQNLANIEADMRALVPQLLESGLSKPEMTLQLEMLVRAYDPCISCSVHLLDIEWH